ncbi:MAG TPA: type II toxin-antitoxin system VapC family toxin [Jatrophihabitantaceae bacterium]|nr:type II toxin-antitoxin system VapC family toxin [Jatrophihabitantaceae bacterium]
MIRYLDTSAAMKLLVEEDESAALLAELQRSGPNDRLIASWLLHTELHCAASRHPDAIDLEAVAVLLDSVDLIDLFRGDLLTAAVLPGRLRSHDAIHLAVALRVGAHEVVTYDEELARATAEAGLAVSAPD